MGAKITGSDDRLRSPALFASVVEQGSFSATGRTLGLTPSAVARAIDRIEARLGVRLLLRSTRALTLTAEGRAYLLGDFARAYPHILIDIALTDTFVDVAAGQADVAIRFGPLADSGLTARKLGESGRVIVTSPDYRARRHPAGAGGPARP